MSDLETFAASIDDKLVDRLRDDLRIAKAAASSAEKHAHESERIRERIFNLTSDPIDAPDWILNAPASDAPKTLHTPVLVTSDFQWGEVISRENLDGLNEFSVAIAQERYRLLIDRTIDISFKHLPRNVYDGLVYLRLGDQISGDIHPELSETNELATVPSIRSLVAAETWGIRQLAERFGKVHVVSVPGNHGRMPHKRKPPTKNVHENFDTLSAWWLESEFRANADVTFQTPASTDAVFELHGRLYLATHGDNIGSRGGQGFIGPAATILRGMKKTLDEYARRGTIISKMFVGHFHTAYDLGLGYSNGSLPGYSEFARVNRMTPETPSQWLIFFHPRYGATSQWKLKLDADAAPATARGVFR